MPLIQNLLVLIVVGILLWLVNRFHPYPGNHQKDLEFTRGHLRRVVAVERLWLHSHLSRILVDT